jgi:hypothetical protein
MPDEPHVPSAQCVHIGSNQGGMDNFGDTGDNVNLISTAAPRHYRLVILQNLFCWRKEDGVLPAG